MGLRECFEAEDLAPYRVWDPAAEDQCSSASFNAFLVTPPRIHAEEVWSGVHGAPFIGALWADEVANEHSGTRINLVSVAEQICSPSWATLRWTFDGHHGRLLDYTVQANGAAAIQDRLVADTGGRLWWFDGIASSVHGGAVSVDPETQEPDTSTVILAADYGYTGFKDFNIDIPAERVFIRDSGMNVGQVAIHRTDTFAKVADIFTPNETQGIVLTHDGFVYLVDELGWITCYDYEGTLLGTMRNPQEVPAGGFLYGWDRFYKRLLYLAGTPAGADGASTLRIKGFYPQPEASILVPAIPTQAPRKNRRIYAFSHLCGEGGEPLAGRRVTTAGDLVTTTATDKDGDILVPVTPNAAGAFTLNLSAETD